MSDKMRAIYEDLRANYFPEPGEYLFFDLSVENYKPQKFSDMWPIRQLMYKARLSKNPNAVISNPVDENLPLLVIDGITFTMEEDLNTHEVVNFTDYSDLDFQKVESEFRQLMVLLNSKAC